MHCKIAPSILAADFTRLGDEVRCVEQAGADMLHVDVMDGHFVPNISMGPLVVEALRRVTRLPLDVHLMIEEPRKYVEPFLRAGANHITFHVEVEDDPAGLARLLHDRGCGAGLCLNPETPVERVLEFLPHLDMLLVMTVHPGFGGQSFLGENLEKARRIRLEQRAKPPARGPIDIEVDGGIDASTAGAAVAAGCNVLVAGSSIFRSPDPAGALRGIRASVEGAGGPSRTH